MVRMRIEASNNSTLFQQQERQLSQAPSTTKYHLAAIDGYVDMLCDASKKETNLMNEENGLTPTLLAALSGQLDALRILVGRGGDPEKASHDGSTALHLAASRNHLNCASFLVNFGVNMWALDNELHTAKDVAAIGQKKEVLDYLDQMMAKQSALNTKSVQKLKEKAKVGAEKRLKQLRKAQLKAIKQVEKDERYLMKLSNNRRLLRAAHSIGDIKLVGRSHHNNHTSDLTSRISYTPSEASSSNSSAGSRSRSSRGGQHVMGTGGGRLSGKSPSITNLIGQNLQIDILGRSRSKLNQFSDADSSAYSCSSVSSVSYLSSYSASANSSHKDQLAAPRPKYSDLVAVNESEAAARLHMASINAGKKSTQKSETAKDKSPIGSPEQQSLKSSTAGTIASKLWGVGGVSRKVHLRRMLQASNAKSTNDLSAVPDSHNDKKTPEPKNQLKKQRFSQSTIGLDQITNEVDNKERLPLDTAKDDATNKSGAEDKTYDVKWSPQPSMTRTVSVPDFGAVLQTVDQKEEITIHKPIEPDEGESIVHHETDVPQSQGPAKLVTLSEDTDAETKLPLPPPPPLDPPMHNADQHKLLTQCLSQLKLRHEAITKQHRQEEPREQQIQQTHKATARDCNSTQQVTSQALFGANSDELIQHQLNAGQFPLRPSAIKQQQRSNCLAACIQQQELQVRSAPLCGRTRVNADSVDSIGSASSFAKRNSRPPSTSSISSTTTTTATSTSCNSCPKSSSQDSGSCSGSSRASSNENKRDISDSCDSKEFGTRLGTCCSNDDKENDETIDTFLMSSGLLDLSSVFAKEKIDLEALMLLTDDDLKSLNILLGPRRKLLRAIEGRRDKLSNGFSYTMSSKYVMVDTQL